METETHKEQIIRRVSTVFVALGMVVLLLMTLPTFPIGLIIIFPILTFHIRKARQTKIWKPPVLSVIILFSLSMYFYWYCGSGALIGNISDAARHALFEGDYSANSNFMSLFGNIWLIYSVIAGYELLKRGNKPYSLVMKVASLFLFTAFFYIYLAFHYHRIITSVQ